MGTQSGKLELGSKEKHQAAQAKARIILIGTSHIAQESVEKVKATITKYPEAIVAVELDKKRFAALLSEGKPTRLSLQDLKRIGFAGFIFGIIGSYVSKKLGELVGLKPGADMLAAIKAAQEMQQKIALIDQDIELTLKRFSQQLTWKEKGRFIFDLLGGIFFQGQQFKKLGITNLDLTKVPPKELIKRMMLFLKERYPSVYHVLIEERNEVMARKLKAIAANHQGITIIAVVGAGHEDGLKELLNQRV